MLAVGDSNAFARSRSFVDQRPRRSETPGNTISCLGTQWKAFSSCAVLPIRSNTEAINPEAMYECFNSNESVRFVRTNTPTDWDAAVLCGEALDALSSSSLQSVIFSTVPKMCIHRGAASIVYLRNN